MKLIKVHGSNNEFFILDEESLESKITEKQLEKLAKVICDRDTGLLGGADGILYVSKGHRNTLGRMRVINSDGSEASMCGNGLRTVARYLSQKNNINEFKVETMYSDLKVKKSVDFADGVPAFEVEISPVSFDAKEIGMTIGKTKLIDEKIDELSEDLKFSALSVPNPHLISFVDHQTLLGPKLERIAKYLNNGSNPLFRDGVNVSFVEVLNSQTIFVRTYERGVGFTNACGTAMSASSLMFTLLFPDAKFEEEITVKNPGGLVKVKVHKKNEGYWMSLIGNATVILDTEISLKRALSGDFKEVKYNKTKESNHYNMFVAFLTKKED